jgi:hypothetical protein
VARTAGSVHGVVWRMRHQTFKKRVEMMLWRIVARIPISLYYSLSIESLEKKCHIRHHAPLFLT